MIPLTQQQAEERPLVSLTEEPTVGGVSTDSIEHTANKMSLATEKPVEQTRNVLITNQEDAFRQNEVLENSLRRSDTNLRILDTLTRQKAQEGTSVTQDETDFILSLTDEKEENLRTVIEKQYAEKVTNIAVTTEERPDFFARLARGDEDANLVLDSVEKVIAQKEIALRHFERLKALQEKQGGFTRTYEFFETWVPFFSAANLKNAIQDAPTSSFLPGNNLQEQAEFLYLLPPDEYDDRLTRAVNEIAESNLNDALTFVSFMANYSSSDVHLENLFGAFDVLDVAGLVVLSKTFRAGAAAIKAGTVSNFKPFIRAMSRRRVEPEDALAASGNVETASLIQAMNKVRERTLPLDPTGGEQVQQLFDLLPAFFNPGGVFRGSRTISDERARKLTEITEIENSELLQSFTNVNSIDRLQGEALQIALREASESFNENYPHLADYVLEVTHSRLATPDEKNIANVDLLLARMGDKQNNLFTSIEHAQLYGKQFYKLKEFRVVRQAPDRYYIEIPHALDETSPNVRQALVETDADRVPVSLARQWLGLLLSAEDLVSKEIRFDRHTVTYGGQAFLKFFRNSARDIGALRKESRENLNTFIDKQRISREVGRTGKMSRDAGEFERDWLKQFGELPEEKEQLAYWNYVRLTNMDIMINNFSILRDKSRAGFRNYDIQLATITDDITAEISKLEGKKVDDIPWANPEDAGILVIGDDLAISSFHRKNSVGGQSFVGREGTEGRTITGEVIEGKPAGLTTFDEFKHKISEFERLIIKTDEIVKEVGGLTNPSRPFTKSEQQAFRRQEISEEELVDFASEHGFPGDPEFFFLTDIKDFIKNLTQKDFDSFRTKLEGRPSREIGGPRITGETTATEAGDIRFLDQSLRDNIRNLVEKEGYTIIQVSPKGEKNIKNFKNLKDLVGDETINFVLARKVQASPLDIRQIPHRPGFHLMYPEGYFLRQPQVKRLVGADGVVRHSYEGDYNLLNFSTEREALFWLPRIEEARKLYREARDTGDLTAFNAYTNVNTPYTADKLAKKFEQGTLDVDIPFRVTFSGTSTDKAFNLGEEFANLSIKSDSSFNLYNGNVNLEFASKRNPPIETIVQRGSEESPDFNLVLAKRLDIFETSNQALSSLLRTRVLSDLQIKSTEAWVQQFGHLLRNVSQEQLLRNPVAALADPDFVKGKQFGPERAAAMNSRRALLQLLGQETEASRVVSWTQQKLLENVSRLMGRNSKEVATTSAVEMAFIKDPGKYFRSGAFHMTLGFWNPVQYFLQAQTLTHIMGISPKAGLQAMPAYWYSRMLNMTHNPAMLEDAARKISSWPKTNWTPSTFKESYHAMMRSGIFDVGQEVAYRSDMSNPKFIKTRAGRFFEKSPFFFNEGERVPRIVGWHTAYLEWRTANPTAKLTPLVERAILDRADLLNVNMTQASNAAWNTGLASIPTQFFSYQARLMEQVLPGLFGKNGRLTRQEALGSMMAHSILYGIPVGVLGTTTGVVWPFWEEVRQELIERGVNVNDKVWSTFISGVPQTMLSAIYGQDFNFSERYGPGGLSFVKEMVKRDKNLFEIMLGVSGSVISDVLETLEPLGMALLSILEEGDDRYPLTINDLLTPLSNISSANQLLKSWYAMNYGIYISRNETLLADKVDWDEGLFTALFGLQRQEISDSFLKIESLEELRDAQQEGKKAFKREIARGLRQDNPEDMNKFFGRAKAHLKGLGLLPSQASSLLIEATRRNPLIESIDMKFKREILMPNAFRKQLQDRKDK